MKVGIFIADSNGGYPVPAVKGGAVSTLVEHLINENNEKQLIDMEVISIYTKEAKEKSTSYPNVSFIWIKTPKLINYIDSIVFWFIRKLFPKKKAVSFKSLFSLIYYIYRAINIVDKGAYDKIVLENNIPLAWVIKKSNFKGDYYYHLHNIPRINAGCKEIFQNATAILCVSKYVAKQIQSEHNPIGPISTERTKILYNCIDTEHFRRVQNRNVIKKYRDKYSIKDNDKVIIFVGRLSKEKGIDKLLDALNDLNRNDVKLLVVGSLIYNVNIQDEYQILLREKAKKLGDNVIFTGYISQDKLPLYYSMSDIAVLPSMWDEPAGLTMIEAMACGLPVITTNSGGISEYVGKNGIIIEKDENVTKNIKESIEHILQTNETTPFEDPSLYAVKHFSTAHYLQDFVACLESKQV